MTYQESIDGLRETGFGQQGIEQPGNTTDQRAHIENLADRHNINSGDIRRLNLKSRRSVKWAEEEAGHFNRETIDGGVLVLGLVHESTVLQSLGLEQDNYYSKARERVRGMYEQPERYGRILTMPASTILEWVNGRTPRPPRPEDIVAEMHTLDIKDGKGRCPILQKLLLPEDLDVMTCEISNLRSDIETSITPVVGNTVLSATEVLGADETAQSNRGSTLIDA